MKGEGNQQDYGMRIYDPRLGRFLSVDPLTKDFPWYTPYQFAGNTPIQAIDLDGEEEKHYTLSLNKDGTSALTLTYTKEYNDVPTWLRVLTFGIGPKRVKLPERAVVTYESKKHYIGFAGSYGRGNENGMALFNEFAKDPIAPLFPMMFLNEDQSYSVEDFSMAVNMQNNAGMYGPLFTKAWFSANQGTHNFKTPLAKRHLATSIGQKTLAKETNTVALPSVDFEADAAIINSGNAAKLGEEFIVNGRIYGQHDGTLYPISGRGLYKLDRGAFKALGVFNEFGDTPKAGEILKNMKMSAEAIGNAKQVYDQIKPKSK